MSFNFKETTRWVIINFFIVITISLFGVSQKDYRQGVETTLFEQALIEVISPVQSSSTSIKEYFGKIVDHYFLLIDAKKENETLKTKIDQLNSKLFSYQEVERENVRLKELVKFSEEVIGEKILAQVIGWDASNEFRVLRINRGENDGVQLKSPVVTAAGLVGYVYRVTNNYSDVLTILDPAHRVDVLVDQTRSYGVLEGLGGNRAILKYIKKNDLIEIGNQVITAGLGSIYPKGIKVGIITDVETKSFELNKNIDVIPSVSFDKLEEVLVITNLEEKGVVTK